MGVRMANNNVEKIILPLIQTMVQRLCLDHFSRQLGLTEPAEQCWLYLQRPDSKNKLKKKKKITQAQPCFYHLRLSDNSTISSRNSAATFLNVGWILMVLVLFYLLNSVMNLLRAELFLISSVMAVI